MTRLQDRSSVPLGLRSDACAATASGAPKRRKGDVQAAQLKSRLIGSTRKRRAKSWIIKDVMIAILATLIFFSLSPLFAIVIEFLGLPK